VILTDFQGSMKGAAIAAIASLGLVLAQPVLARDAPQSFADLVDKLMPTVVNITTTQNVPQQGGPRLRDMPQLPPGSPFEELFKEFFDKKGGEEQKRRGTSLGSGFVVDGEGYIVTNNHVIQGAEDITVIFKDDTQLKAKLVGSDSRVDVALLKVEPPNKKPLPAIKWGDSDKERVGDWVVAVGNPYGLGGTVTAGIISAEGRDIGSGPYDDYIQIDAPINKGNSGGPTFDTKGNVIGVNTAIYSPSGGSVGIGFDIPAATVKMVVAQLKDKGSVTRAYIGVQVQPVTSGIAESLGMKNASGALVDEAQPDTPAAKAGVQAGDVITAVNGNPIKDSRTLAREISVMAPGSTAKLDILRKGEQKSIEVTLAKMPNQPEKQAKAGDMDNGSAPHLDISVAPASDVAGAGSKGVVITAVDPEGPAAEHGLKSGDVILDVGGKSVSSAGELRGALSDAKSGGKHDVLIRVKSADNTHFVAMPIG